MNHNGPHLFILVSEDFDNHFLIRVIRSHIAAKYQNLMKKFN